jgi:putative FmdB family regulatory protein
MSDRTAAHPAREPSPRFAGRVGVPPYTHLVMPTYEYRCTKGHTFDAFQSISDDPLTKCEVCGRPVVRVLHSPAVHFKGSGFYNTDYGTKKRQREQKASTDSGSSSDGASSTNKEKAASSDGATGGGSKDAADKKSTPAS